MTLTTAELIEDLEANRAMFDALIHACQSLSPKQQGVNDWDVKETIAHIASVDLLTIQKLLLIIEGRKEVAGQQTQTEPELNLDKWNEVQVKKRAEHTTSALLTEMKMNRKEALRLLHLLPANAVSQEVSYPANNQRPSGRISLQLWLQVWSKHDMVHAQEILDSIPKLKNNRDFQAWLSNDPILEAIDGPRP